MQSESKHAVIIKWIASAIQLLKYRLGKKNSYSIKYLQSLPLLFGTSDTPLKKKNQKTPTTKLGFLLL